MFVIMVECGIGEYPFFQVITDKDANTFVDIVGLQRSGFRFTFNFLCRLIYLTLPFGSLETSSHPVTLLLKDPDRSTLP